MAQEKNGNKSALPLGLGVAAAAAAAAGGAYWLYGAKHSAKHRKMAKSWMLKARAEVMDAMGELQDIDKERYMQIVERVLKNYTGGASREELTAMAKDLKGAWAHIQGKKKGGSKKGAKKSAARKSTPRRKSTKK